MKLQDPQETHGLQHLRDEHLQAALQLDEEAADLWVDLSILRPSSVKGRKGTMSPHFFR